ARPVPRAQPARAHRRDRRSLARRAAGERRGGCPARRARRVELRLPERGSHTRAVARARGGRGHDGARRAGSPGVPHRSHRVRERPRRGVVRRGRDVPGARRTARGAARAHRVLERRSAPRGRPGGDRARYRGGARVDVTVAVVGAGLAGLSAAWALSRAGAEVVVLDAGRQPGGMIVTERHDGFIVEGGPDGFLTAEPDIQELAREIGIGDRLVGQVARGSTMWTGRTLEPIAEGKAAELLGIQSTAPLQAGFTSFAAGMQEIVDALVARLGPRVRTTQGVSGMAP